MPNKSRLCPWCGGSKPCTFLDYAFHKLMRKHDLHPWCDSGIGDGRLPLVDRLCADLKAQDWTGRISQIKEKFGTLSFYACDTDDAMEARIDDAAQESAVVCETCGKPGELRRKYWLRVACDECNARYLAERGEDDDEVGDDAGTALISIRPRTS